MALEGIVRKITAHIVILLNGTAISKIVYYAQ